MQPKQHVSDDSLKKKKTIFVTLAVSKHEIGSSLKRINP